ncbi:MAG TPA: hypothetical protein VK779_05265, partial [Rhizomicrobium sp.]|nr:hypothetical protein [Rhizomicrobium sp.]
AVIAVLVLIACSRTHAPVGRWEGTYDTNNTMVAARLEIEPNGMVRASAPDASLPPGASDQDRAALRQRLAGDLAAAWQDALPKPMDFDGREFHKPGGIARQMIWDADKKQMTLVLYLGTDPAIYIPMRAVGDFSDNPWGG